MKKALVLTMAALSLFVMNCSHTNNLDKFDLSQQTMYFEEVVTADASKVDIYYSQSKPAENKELELFKEIATAIGKSALSSDAERKLENAANPEEIVESVSGGIESCLIKYLKVKPTKILDDQSDFIVTTILENCKLVSNPQGIYISIEAQTTITYRNTGEIVWENSERENAPIRESAGNVSGEVGGIISNIAQAAELATMSEKQISNAINAAAQEVGHSLGETLRHDIAEARKEI